MKKFLLKIKKYAIAHKVISSVAVVVVLSGSFYTYSKMHAAPAAIQYVLGRVMRGDLIESVSGTGQVATLSAVDIKAQTVGQAQTLGQITTVNVQNGDFVNAGDVIAVLDGRNALQAYNQAKASVAIAQANYNKLVNGPTALDLESLNNTVSSAETSLDNTVQNILIKFKTTYATVSGTVYVNTDSFFDNSTGQPVLNINGVSLINQPLEMNIENERSDISTILNNFKTRLNNESSSTDIISDLNYTILDLNKMSDYFANMTMLFSTYSISSSASSQTALNSAKSAANSAESSINSAISDLTSLSQTYKSQAISLQQDKDILALKIAAPGTDDLTVVKSNLDNAEANLENARANYQSRIITAPFSGQVGGLNAQIGQQVSSADSLGKIITAQKVVNISLNEVDAAKVAANDDVVLTFDALPGVSIKGHIIFVDPLGSVSQGVVSYAVRVSLDDQNDAIKTGMTASAKIITATHANVLLVPNGAITTNGGKKYVSIVASSTLESQFGNASGTRMFGTSTGNYSGRFGTATSSFGGFGSSTASSSRRMKNASSTQMKSSMNTTTAATLSTTKVEVQVGISNNVDTEIISGLFEGETIVARTISGAATTKSSAAAATSRPVTNQTIRSAGGFQ